MTHNHKEAFCLMQYHCRPCGHTERIWNSRDGVTPFGMVCPSCGRDTLVHINFLGDRYAPDYAPHHGQRVWVSMSQGRAETIAKARIAHFKNEFQTDDFLERLVDDIYRDGTAPDLMVYGYEIKELA